MIETKRYRGAEPTSAAYRESIDTSVALGSGILNERQEQALYALVEVLAAIFQPQPSFVEIGARNLKEDA